MLVKNEKYKAFLRGEMMETIPREDFTELLGRVKHRQQVQARCLLSLVWMSGKRPNEILNITAGDISKKGKYLTVKIKGSKGGFSGPTMLPLKDALVAELWAYSKDKFPEQFLFWAFRSKSKKNGAVKRMRKKQADGSYIVVEKRYDKVYGNVSNNLYYWFIKWVDLPAYYFRHNRLTLAAGSLDANNLMLLKGARSMESIRPYLHYNEKTGKKIAGQLVK